MSTSAASGYADACTPLTIAWCEAPVRSPARDPGCEEHAMPVDTTARASEPASDRLMAHDPFAAPLSRAGCNVAPPLHRLTGFCRDGFRAVSSSLHGPLFASPFRRPRCT